jgi:adenylate kinase
LKLILVGPPGAGKGTQAERLSKILNIPTISTGNILRAAMKARTPMGLAITEAMDAGHLVSDDLVIRIVEERVTQEDCADGYILDGMPRTLAQAEALECAGFRFDAVILMQPSDEEIMQRMSGRRVCENCGDSYHVTAVPPKVEGVCDDCGGRLVRRPDDEPETVKERLEIYHRETEPIISFYAERGLLKAVDCTSDVEGTLQTILRALGV